MLSGWALAFLTPHPYSNRRKQNVLLIHPRVGLCVSWLLYALPRQGDTDKGNAIVK